MTAALETLGAELSRVDDLRLLAVVSQLERMRDRSRVEPLIAPARARLRTLRPERRMTLQRLHCLPFEDLLVSRPDRTPSGRISRAAIVPTWQLITAHMPDTFSTLERELLQGETPEVIADRLWREAARALREILDRAERDEVTRRQLERERPDLQQELQTIYRYLSTADEIQYLKRTLGPAPVTDFGQEEVDQLRGSLVRANQSGGSAMHLLLVAAARSADPEAVLQVFSGASGTVADLRHDASAALGGFLLGGFEQRMSEIARIEQPRKLAETLGQLLERMSGTEELMRRDYGHGPAFDEEVAAIKTLARETVEHRLIPDARGAVQALLTTMTEGGTGQDVADRAEDQVRALRHARAFASQVGAGGAVTLALQSLTRDIERQTLQTVQQAAARAQMSGDGSDPQVGKQRSHLLSTASQTLAGAARLLELANTGAAAHRFYSEGQKLLQRR